MLFANLDTRISVYDYNANKITKGLSMQ